MDVALDKCRFHVSSAGNLHDLLSRSLESEQRYFKCGGAAYITLHINAKVQSFEHRTNELAMDENYARRRGTRRSFCHQNVISTCNARDNFTPKQV